MQQPGREGAGTSDRQYENSSNHGSINGSSTENTVLSALPPPMPSSRKLGQQPSVGNNVESVINKAKKAASSLYTLLHAKVRDHRMSKGAHQIISNLTFWMMLRIADCLQIGVHIQDAPRPS